MNISIFGLGYVGCVSLGCLANNGHRVIGVDVSQNKVDLINNGKPTIIEKDIDIIIAEQHKLGTISATTNAMDAVLNSEICIIAVGTPSTPQGHLNLKYIFQVAENIGKALRNKEEFQVVAIRSTVLPGTCDKVAAIIEEASGKKRNVAFAIVDNPEFLREGTAVEDYYNPPLTLIGSDNKEAAEKLGQLYSKLPGEIITTDLKVAEVMKYVNNTFHALKISFGNEVGNVCSALGIDSHQVMDIFCKDKQLNISNYYFKPGFAYGGSCLPKDLKGFQTLAHDLYVKTPVIDGIGATNEIQIERAIDIIQRYPNKKLGFLGLSFKAGTDDLRNSPAVRVVEALLGKGANINIYDKNINTTMLTGTNRDYIDARIPHLSKLLVSDLNSLVQDSEVLIINTKEEEFKALASEFSDKIIIDFVRLDESLLNNENYIGINWSSVVEDQQNFVSGEDTVLN
ncbi:GDP-mannose 6-dehydrogenase [Polaribacter sp. Hel1_33_96]|jgi:GDP-mannose 6-dehydrogenase|uniref:nucleotide sugar dehydrogenase n=1 Tax=Polaribacter sp. Hel1_33_96 TaxID=1336805 RepID=UPI000C703459|nr:nucleotide sugar dehydrogenase [Polaribacter sp. Hel1_33_96]PKV65413.1 GDP-mannose 6-dehydrogenase [Polaribacter sp. Hel1_33_96]